MILTARSEVIVQTVGVDHGVHVFFSSTARTGTVNYPDVGEGLEWVWRLSVGGDATRYRYVNARTGRTLLRR
jgi:hypothetical protein